MNSAFVNVIQRIVNQQGEAILDNPARLKQFVHKDAKTIPAELRLAFGRCIEQGYYRLLKRAGTAAERARIKPQIARQMHSISKLDEALCAEAVDVLEAVLYGPRYANAAQQPPRHGQSAFHLPRISKHIQKIGAAFFAAAAAAAIIIIAALNSGAAVFEPIVEFNGEAYPSKIVATAAAASMLGGGPRMVETESYIGDALGDFGVKFRSASAADMIRVEIEGDHLIYKSVLETQIKTNKTVEIFPRITYNFADLEKLEEAQVENVTFSLYVNDKLKKKQTMAVPFHGMDDEPVWDATRNGNKTLTNYHFVVVVREFERIERELEKIQRDADEDAAKQREAERRAEEAERTAAEMRRRAEEAERRRVTPSPPPLRDPYNDKRIWETLTKVHDNIYDVNGDRKTNCVDYSNLFYYYSPFKYTDVVVNYNPNSDFNHMFNAVKINGQIIYVEPQSKSGKSYDLQKFWGARYNPYFNQMNNTRWLYLPRGESGTEE
jgi:hypothetical protein